MLNIFYEEDNRIVKNRDKINYDPSDIRYTLNNEWIYDFVGFIIDKKNMVAVFPKHFFDENNIFLSNKNSIRLLFQVINKYIIENKSNATANKYTGTEENYVSDYPFAAFYSIYDYYKKYGIYKEEEFDYKRNSQGKVSWKKTIQKSNIIVSNGNIIYLPLISKKRNFRDDFISECMTFVINYTIKTFPFFLSLKKIDRATSNFDFLANKKYVIEKLHQERNRIFKDNQKRLIDSLIEFFEQYDKNSKGGAMHFKVKYFDRVWESMIEKYLDDYFVGVDEKNSRLIFDYTNKNKEKKFISQKVFNIDDSNNNFKIIPDHYYETQDSIYVFDSKYYNHLNELNYKQFAYTILIGNSKYGNNKQLYSALILPGSKENGIHIKLAPDFKQLNEGCNKIIEQYIKVSHVMKNYLDMEINDEQSYKSSYEEYENSEDNLKMTENQENYKYE